MMRLVVPMVTSLIIIETHMSPHTRSLTLLKSVVFIYPKAVTIFKAYRTLFVPKSMKFQTLLAIWELWTTDRKHKMRTKVHYSLNKLLTCPTCEKIIDDRTSWLRVSQSFSQSIATNSYVTVMDDYHYKTHDKVSTISYTTSIRTAWKLHENLTHDTNCFVKIVEWRWSVTITKTCAQVIVRLKLWSEWKVSILAQIRIVTTS